MTKKKVALAINYDYHDYGGMLQAFATQKALDKLGVDSEAINFDSLKGDINKRKWKYFLSNLCDATIVKEKSRVISKKLRMKFDSSLGGKMAQRDAAFDQFCHDGFKVSRMFESWEDLSGACRNYDAVIVGSDQLWLPSNVAGDYYTLSFVPDDVKKIAYATSFGIGAIPENMKAQYSRFLNRINYLSARETSGQEIIKVCTGRDVQLVCDPTMLLEVKDWSEIASSRPVDGDYIFCYLMGDNPVQREFVKKLAKKENCKIVALLHLDQYISADEDYVDEAPYNISPAGFVSLVNNAKYICTDSFHGTVFSIIFSKNFFTFKRFNKKASLSTNTRLTSLLNNLGLNERLFTGFENVDNNLDVKNYPLVQENLRLFRDESIRYLMKSIES
ncbi:Polysaccharide pyruvyl transferase [Prevotella sp. ne3005]|uniref:polysaccharide pyruvyl transferase family protein n=1 Tax=Prevotella sp. ne3005 TaxID=1761887 RepID=UPI0008BC575A|nr:polysaccharide pyruvyl transferase family protein [Prevotella sp. ne3005]SEM53948.1 Polysaccharide pyruvyl transferase [Prevotella sp. ne3005]